ncbi:MAG: coat protein 1 [Plant associated deltapartitivirus 1]|nr:MAG: coat protein 1 [Plant associated deltapartitivirus 1]
MAITGSVANVYTGLNRDELDNIVDLLQDECQIGTFTDRSKSHRRYVTLRVQQLFATLVSLYTNLFISSWSAFKHVHAPDLPTQAGVVPVVNTDVTHRATNMARQYLTAWFWDLHVSIRDAVYNLSATAYTQYFSHEVSYISRRYDPFLQHLNSTMRPTHIQVATEDTLFIPVLVLAEPTWTAERFNPFGIHNGGCDLNTVHSIIEVMENKRNDWSTVPLSTSNLGRPAWLFDYRDGNAFAWFPFEPNYTRLDLVAPFILGIPCTPRLGPRDVDEYQIFTNNLPPETGVTAPRPNPSDYQRITERKFYGNAEYRTIELSTQTVSYEHFIPAQAAVKKRKTTKDKSVLSIGEGKDTEVLSDEDVLEYTTPEPYTLYVYRLIDWVYHARVIVGTDEAARRKALNDFIFKTAYEANPSRRN